MSENITHTAVVDDALRLLGASDEICEPLKQVAAAHPDMAQLGCMTRSGDLCNPSLLATLRERWFTRTEADHLEPKLAFVLGWLCHRAADRQMKPVFRRFHPPGPDRESPTECSVYHDAFIFREVYVFGQERPYHPAMFGELFQHLAESIAVADLQTLTEVLLRRALIEMHTLIPDVEHPETWIDNLYRLKQDFYVNLARYDAAIHHPDPEKVQRYIVDDGFYDAQEPMIAAARALQRGRAVGAAEVRQATQAPAVSHYGKALQTSFGYLRVASEFFVSEMTVDALKERLDIGKPGRDGVAV